LIYSRRDYFNVDFCEELRARGVTVSKGDLGVRITGLVAFNHSAQALAKAIDEAVPVSQRILIVEEPPPVRPDQYRSEIYGNYGHVVCTSNFLASQFIGVDTSVVRIADMPKIRTLPSLEEYRARENSACIIQANKFSCVPHERYTLRRSAISFAQKRSIPIAVYGKGWNQGFERDWWQFRWALSNARRNRSVSPKSFVRLGLKVRDYRGTLESKWDALDSHRLSLVIENFSEYTSEKVLDSVAGGTLTLYIGPDLAECGLPSPMVEYADPHAKRLVSKVGHLLSLPAERQYELLSRQHTLATVVMDQFRLSVHQRLATLVSEILRAG